MDIILAAKTIETFVSNNLAETAAPVDPAKTKAPLPGMASPLMLNASKTGHHKEIALVYEDEDDDVAISPLYMVVGICIGVYAAYLSWTCNTAQGIEVPLKVIYAMFAYFFGLIYLVLFMIFRWGTCHA